MNSTPLDPQLAKEAKAIVALAFRNGPIEDLHAGRLCPMCGQDAAYSRISNPEMKQIMQSAVNKVYKLLWLKEHNPERYAAEVQFGERYTSRWDEPEIAAEPAFNRNVGDSELT
jgi:hypothetical protein